MTAETAWQALTSQPPLRFLRSSWPWRSLAYLLSGAALGAATLAALVAVAFVSALLTLAVVGLVGFAAIALSGVVVARVERRRLRLVDSEPIADPHQPPQRPGWRAWLGTRLREQATWRELAYTLLSACALWMVDLAVAVLSLVIPLWLLGAGLFGGLFGSDRNESLLLLALVGVVLLPVAPYVMTAWAGSRAVLTRTLLAPREAELGERLVEVTRSRARIVDAFESERRRIERDLHDGVQQRLVALTVTLGLARLDLAPDSPVAEQLGEAQDQAKQALAEMRELIRGVHPQVLTDRGLPAAVQDVAGRSPVPVTVDVDLPRRPPPPVEAAAYFAVCEALANVVKHSRATRASVRGWLDRAGLVVEVRDDGVGGADPSAGTGLTGLADRVSVVDGRLMLSSPEAGPTLIRVEIPWAQADRSG